MGTKVLRDHKVMPWSNGAGITYEVVRSPESGDFDWRVSLAEIENDGPFSVLSGIDRSLVLLEGEQVILTNADKTIRLEELIVYNFPGEVPFECTLTSGPAKDLNIMTRRNKFSSKTEVLGPRSHLVDATKDTHILVGLRGETTVDGEKLAYREAAIITGNVEVTSTGSFAHIVFTAV